MAHVIYAEIKAACKPDATPGDLVERYSVERLLDYVCRKEFVPKAAQDLLLLPVVSTLEQLGDAMGEARRVIQDRLSPHFAVTFGGGGPSAVKWIPTQIGHETIGLALQDSGDPIEFDAKDEGSGKTYTGVILFVFHAIGANPKE